VIASDSRFAAFGTAVFAVLLRRLDQKLADGNPDEAAPHGERARHQARVVAGVLRPLIAPGDETVVLYADGKPVEIPVI